MVLSVFFHKCVVESCSLGHNCSRLCLVACYTSPKLYKATQYLSIFCLPVVYMHCLLFCNKFLNCSSLSDSSGHICLIAPIPVWNYLHYLQIQTP